MLKHIVLLLCFVSIQASVDASENKPSSLDKSVLGEALEEVVMEESSPKEVSEGTDVVIDKKDDVQESQRQKRYFEYGFNTGLSSWSSAIPPNYHSYIKRDSSQNYGVYGASTINEDALTLIYKRLQDIANSARRQYLPPDPPRPIIPIPTFIPYRIYIPQIGCGCGSTPEIQPARRPLTPSPSPLPPTKAQQTQQTPKPDDGSITNPPMSTPDLSTRVNVPDETSTDNHNPVDDEDDGARPISFVPIPPKRPLNVKVPEVEHGSFQAGVQPLADSIQYPLQQTPQLASNSDAPIAPSACEGAILRCCLQYQDNTQSPQAKQCFILEGCSDPSAYADPCHPQILLPIVNKLREFYKKRAG